MEVGWYFYRFDYARYLELRPALRSSTTPAAFAALAEDPETAALAEALHEETITVSEARKAFVQAACCLGDPLQLESGLPRFITALARRPGKEDAAELLGEMLAGGKHLEDWLLPATGLSGFLTPDETHALQQSYRALPPRRRPKRQADSPTKRRSRRRGGLVGLCVGFVARLFDRGPQPDDIYHLLGELIDEAARNGEGLAVVAA